MINRINGLTFEKNRTSLSTYEHVEHFGDYEVSLVGEDCIKLLDNEPLIIKEEFEDNLVHTKDLRNINNILYSLKTRSVDVGIWENEPLIKMVHVGECEAFYKKEDASWHIYKKINGWKLTYFKDESLKWFSECRNFYLEQSLYKGEYTYKFFNTDGTEFENIESVKNFNNYYETPEPHVISLYTTKNYKKYFQKLKQILEK